MKVSLYDLKNLTYATKLVIPVTKIFNHICYIHYKIPKAKNTQTHLYIISENNLNLLPYMNRVVDYISKILRYNKKYISFSESKNNCYKLILKNIIIHRPQLTIPNCWLMNNKLINSQILNFYCNKNLIDVREIINLIKSYNFDTYFINEQIYNSDKINNFIIAHSNYFYIPMFDYKVSLCLRDLNL